MESLREHFRSHGAVHALWLISVLLAIIAALILMSPNGAAVGEYIAFATSIASLVLAVVAIGQTLISNQGFSETVGALRSSADNIQVTARNIADSSSLLSQKAEFISEQAEKVPSVVEALSAKLDDRIFRKSSAEISQADAIGPGRKTEQIYGGSTFGTIMCLYAMSKAFKENKAIDTSSILSGIKAQIGMSGVMLGFLNAMRDLGSCGIVVDYALSDNRHLYRVTNMGSIDPDIVISLFEKYDDKEGNLERASIDNYFSNYDAATEVK